MTKVVGPTPSGSAMTARIPAVNNLPALHEYDFDPPPAIYSSAIDKPAALHVHTIDQPPAVHVDAALHVDEVGKPPYRHKKRKIKKEE